MTQIIDIFRRRTAYLSIIYRAMKRLMPLYFLATLAGLKTRAVLPTRLLLRMSQRVVLLFLRNKVFGT